MHLVKYGKKPIVLDSGEPWNVISEDPSIAISPYTKDRIRNLPKGSLKLKGNSRVSSVEKTSKGFKVLTQNESIETPNRPILATGFRTSLVLIKDLFDRDDKGHFVLNEKDESTKTKGIFLCGPYVWHKDIVHCFIYKFRTRFGVIANELAKRLHLSYLDDSYCFAPAILGTGQ